MMTTGRTVHCAAPQLLGRAASSLTEVRVKPVTKMHEAKRRGVGHTSDFGNGLNFGGFSFRLGPNRPQQQGSRPMS